MRTEEKIRLVRLLQERLGEPIGRVRCDVSLARYTSFRIGGPADLFVEPDTIAELQTLVELAQEEKLPFFLLGGGSNLLVSDNGIRGIVVKLGYGFRHIHWQEHGATTHVRVGAARPLGRFVREAVAKGYGGIEFAEGIPGSLGGGLLMNAGAFGGELSQVVEAVHGVDQSGNIVTLPGDHVGFGYRKTGLPARFIVAEVWFTLYQDHPHHLMARVLRARTQRQKGQPHGYPNAGSIFKNPPGTSAGRLIESAGLKGATCGRACVSQQHANFIVNTGGAQATEVKQLMEQVQRRVWDIHQVWLEPEVRLVGAWQAMRMFSGPQPGVAQPELRE